MAFTTHVLTLTTVALIGTLTVQSIFPELLSSYGISHRLLIAIVIGASIFFAAIWRAWVYPTFFDPLRYLPGPKGGIPLVRYGLEGFQRPPSERILEWINNVPNNTDGLLRFPGFFGRQTLIPTSPKILSELLVTKSYDFQKIEQGRSLLRLVLGDGLVVVEGDIHRFQRKNLNPMFSFRHIKDLHPLMWAKAVEMVQCVRAETYSNPTGCMLEVHQWASRATLDIIGVAALGREFNTLHNSDDALARLYEWLFKPTSERMRWFVTNILLTRRIGKWLPWKEEKEVLRRSVKLREISRELVKNKREAMKRETETVQTVDTLAHLIRSNNFSDEQLVDQMLTFLAAGHETTSSAFTWALYMLAKHKQYQTLLRAEVRPTFGPLLKAKDLNATALDSALDSLPYLNAICVETLRLYPSVPSTIRVAVRDTSLGPHRIPEGTWVYVPPWQINRSPHLWGPKAGDFVPERWIDFQDEDGQKAGKFNNHGGAPSNFAMLTFLHGPRACIGQGFAKAELKALLAAFVSAFEFEMRDPDEKIVPFGPVTVKPRDGLWLKVWPVKDE